MKNTVSIAALQTRLDAAALPETKDWFEAYLRGAITYRGVKTPVVTRIVKAWAKENGVLDLDVETQLAIISDLLAQPVAEDKFAAILYMQTFLKAADPALLLSTIETAFENGRFFDWSTTDWLCVRVLDPLILRNGEQTARRIADWSKARDLWQRRASVVSFRHAIREPSMTGLAEAVVNRLVVEEARFIQTGIGWLLSDWSKIDPGRVAILVERHFDTLSREVIDRHTKHLPDHKDYKARKR